MNQEAKTILTILEQYLTSNPDIRFTQALFNLNINEFSDNKNPEKEKFNFRDNFNDKDWQVLANMSKAEFIKTYVTPETYSVLQEYKTMHGKENKN